MKITKILLTAILTLTCSYSNAQDKSISPLKSDLTKNDIKNVLKAVADWQIKAPLTHHIADWTNAALYAGMVQWAGISGDESYFEWLKGKAEQNYWYCRSADDSLGRYHADDYCVGQTYIELYRKYKDVKMIEPVKAHLDSILKDPAKGDLEFIYTDKYWPTQRWAWCDALFMGPTVWAKMANVTGEKKYLDFMFQEYKATTDYLYDKEENLYYRDSRYFTMREANGSKVFWGRGNGWVFAGLPVILSELPSGYEHKDYFVKLFKEMAAKILSLQTPDGFWHASLLDPSSYPNPEMSATAFFVFGFAWGINNGYLDKKTYLPAIIKGWKSMVANVEPDGKVGFIQPIGADPKAVTKDMTEVYGVGGFLMAGTEIARLLDNGIL
jgi:unsaturated rhamnogalacturonyl hydrolase